MPKLLARPTPVPHQIKMVEFLSEIAISFGRVVAIERSFLCPHRWHRTMPSRHVALRRTARLTLNQYSVFRCFS